MKLLSTFFGLSTLALVHCKAFLDYIEPEVIRENLRYFTTETHVAGTPANLRVAGKIAEKWSEYGLEDVGYKTYEVLLSYPNFTSPNTITISENGKSVFHSTGRSTVILPDEQGAPGADIQWLAYAGDGHVKGEPVFCNYGTANDFETLKKLGISLKGKIAVVRYGKVYRGNKVKFAQDAGAVAVILYSDPAEAAEAGTEKKNVYPNKDYMPHHGVQRGSLIMRSGDPLSPMYPAKKDLSYNTTIDELKKAQILPTIPVLPLSYSDAYEIFKRLEGDQVLKEWQGGLNVLYRFEGKMKNNALLEVDVHSGLEKREIQNVIGYIKGETEPDRYVMLGNHFDARVFASIDPNSGTAILSEIAKALVQAKKDGVFKPKRTIVFCNSDAEEYGLVGSNEFVEEFANILRDRAVVMLNVDLISGNATVTADTLPSIYEVVVNAAKKVPNPVKSEVEQGRKTIYDTW
ncbi:unnamed protein product [Bursaphelenchus okinawaensis]|uniref:Peptide hydrolase n=1 Tax=Bursaphelenchus okinawaensis TaxID=465554 RepID=A0A811LJD8_9BILA|nr:unnamed protein product [Bursaphelenchus okinawaensis]CAG9127206.1 unnamed protein product [Bursaphelenchus okinawaensis]